MKKIKVSILALSVLVGGAVFASAASSTLVGSTSDVTLTSVPPLAFSEVFDLPTSALLNATNGFDTTFTDVFTDASGKIWGVGNVLKRYFDATGTNVVAISSWYMTVKGNITASTMDTPTINMKLSGQGYIAPSTNATIVIPGNSVDTFPGKFNLTFSAKNATPVLGVITGTLKVTITPATKNGKPTQINEPALLAVDRVSLNTLTMRIIASGTKFNAISFLGGTATTGTGNINKNTGKYNLTLKPIEGGSSSLKLAGQASVVISATNFVTLNTADITGKIQGQAVKSSAVKITAQ
jgi:hypothetical protein